jgi:hypothetical protein
MTSTLFLEQKQKVCLIGHKYITKRQYLFLREQYLLQATKLINDVDDINKRRNERPTDIIPGMSTVLAEVW